MGAGDLQTGVGAESSQTGDRKQGEGTRVLRCWEDVFRTGRRTLDFKGDSVMLMTLGNMEGQRTVALQLKTLELDQFHVSVGLFQGWGSEPQALHIYLGESLTTQLPAHLGSFSQFQCPPL